MLYKEDWEQCKNRFDAFWQGEIIDRCCIAVTAPRSKPLDTRAKPGKARDLVEKWMGYEYRKNEHLYEFSTTFYGGEAFPMFRRHLGAGVLSACIGSSYLLAEDTVWFDVEHVIHNWESKPEIKFNQNSEMWSAMRNLTENFCRDSKGNYFVAISDLGGNYDIAAALRGTEDLLYDLNDYPEEVKLLIEQIDNTWFELYEKQRSIIKEHMEGTSSWMPLWCSERWYPLQCDFSAMISPAMFEEFVLPSLEREAGFLDKSIYHLDGTAALVHVDYLLDIERLTGIQWTPGAGNPDVCSEKWYPLYKKIQAKGKNLVLIGVRPENIERLLRNISPEGLYIHTTCGSEEDAKELIKCVEKWSV